MVRALVLLGLLLAAPTAAACSLAGPVPAPGAFTLVPMDGGEPVVIAVDGRELGAGCELSNPHALADGTFAWREVAHDRHGPRYEVHLLDLATREERVVEYASGHTDGFALWGTKLIYTAREYHEDGAPPRSEPTVLDLSTGDKRILPFPAGNLLSVTAAGPNVAAILRANGHEGADSIYLYDIARDAWVLEGKPVKEVTGADQGWAHLMTDEWLVIGSQRSEVFYHVPTGEVLGASRDEPRIHRSVGYGVVDGWVYTGVWDGDLARERLMRYRFPNGPLEPVEGVPDGRLLGVVPGYYVLGEYSAPDLDPWARFRWLGRAAPWIVGAAFVLSTPAIWLVRRRRGL